MSEIISVENISFKYSINGDLRRSILDNVCLTINSGESVAIMGPNGSGKTTFARCLNGLLVPTEGNITVDGLSTKTSEHLSDIRRKVGMVFQNPDNQIVSATVEREIAFGLENLGLPIQQMHDIVEEMLSRFNLKKYRLKSPHYLSGGEKQKLAIASVLAMRPTFLILDEPTSLLDPRSRSDILNIVQELHSSKTKKQSNIATILITQFPEEALLADRLIVFYNGSVILDDSPEVVFERVDELKQIGLEIPVSFRVRKLLDTYKKV